MPLTRNVGISAAGQRFDVEGAVGTHLIRRDSMAHSTVRVGADLGHPHQHAGGRF